MKKPGYNPFSLISLGAGNIASAMALSNPVTAPYAPAIGTTVAAAMGGIELNEEHQTIQDSIDSALTDFWKKTGIDYNLTDSCLNELKSELIDKGVKIDEFIANATNKGLSGAMDTIIASILLKHREELEEKNRLNADSRIKWDVLHTAVNSKKISEELVTTIENAIRHNDLIKILVRMEKNRISEKEEHELLEKTVVDKANRILEEIHNLYTILIGSQSECSSANPTDFCSYYELVKKRFTGKKQGEYKKLVGEFSDEEAYIDTFISVDNKPLPVLSYLEKWFDENDSGTMLIHGEPGHGKSLLCDKAMFEFYEGRLLNGEGKTATNVLSVSLSAFNNIHIIKDGKVDPEEKLYWGRGRKDNFALVDCQGALLFLDGFDEVIDESKKVGMSDIVSFIKELDDIAFIKDIHIVVLSRTIAVADYLKEAVIRDKEYKLMTITEQQQDDWLEQHSDYNDYKDTFKYLRTNRDMGEILGIPFLFRMIVHSRFDQVGNNVVDLYEKLTDHLMDKRDIRDEDLDYVLAGLCNLAYNIYCNDTDTVAISKNKWDTRWIFAFYIRQTEKRVIGFYHRSFYQYFLARYILSRILNVVTDKQSEDFIGLFAERELDDTVRQFLSLLINQENKQTIHNKLKLVIEALVRTEAYLNLKPRYPTGKAEKTKIGRTINVYRNTLHICAAFSYVIEKTFKDGIDVFLRIYPSHSITICSVETNRANLSGADLSGADLSGADLRGADLRGADLRGADLRRADLRGADLSGADLSGADLRRADLSGADLSGAYLRRADLRGADLRGADLSGAYLWRADLRGADLSRANLIVKFINLTIIDSEMKDLIDPSIKGYETIMWE